MCSVTVPRSTTAISRLGLVHRRVALAAGRRAGRQLVAAELCALAGHRRGEDLELVAGGAAAATALGGPDDGDAVGLVEAQRLAET